MRHVARLVALAFGFVSALSPLAAPARSAPATGLRGLAYGALTPDFAFDSGAGPERLSALRGKPVVLNFWASWCGPCRDELPVFSQLEREYGAAVTLVTLSNEAPGPAAALFAQLHLALPLAEGAGATFERYGIGPIPVTLVLDASGRLTYVSLGELNWTELHQAVEQALTRPGRAGPA